ncbi:prepilin peptidase [Cohnella lubricantis]|uniref:Prepilin peptidase n=1 Tax=Cohnella lubricantis TaxID=2163172 RepID=A0A841TK08_9BACL|nr:prepilin peptidase [Cohnella lubricantis]MBB6679530.1 prepilin peptidase [Cohnella lubricantis]MBP2119250.1 prepilin peptidase CpaA [Cohnella lubricantis]
MWVDPWIDLLLLLVLAVCVLTDLRSRRIYNAVVLPSLVLAFVIHTMTAGRAGLTESLLGFAAGLGILLIPYLMGGMGAGDVKLLALVGALKGVSFVLAASVYMAIFGGAIALAIVLFKGGLRNRIRFVGYAFTCLRFRMLPRWEDGTWTSGSYPYGVAIAGGALICMWLEGWGPG